jgi:tetratricopeptide (TPR) repeat protein
MAAAAPDQGRAAFAEGQKLFVAGDFREALTWFKNGYMQTQDPAFLLNIAQCHRSLGESQEALMMFRLYLKSSPEGLNPQARAVASTAIKELESGTASTKPGPIGSTATPAAAPAATRAATPPGALPVPDSGRKFQTAPGGMPVLEPTPELDAARTEATAAATPDTTAGTRRNLRLAAVVCGAVGLASVGTGVYYWTRARSLSDSANQTTVYTKSYYDDGKRAQTMQWIFFGAGAAALATSAGLFAYGQWFLTPTKASVSLAPMAAPGTAGLSAVGTF